jgi:DNA-binding transcriptional LysR family regulator
LKFGDIFHYKLVFNFQSQFTSLVSMLPDNDSLALFVKAAECGSLTKAAEASHMSLGAASRRIALLEHKFNAPLFDRTSKGIQLTLAGKALISFAKNILMDLNKMQSEMSTFEIGSKGVIRVLAASSAMAQFLPADLARFSKKYPDYRLIVHEAWSNEIIQSVLSGDADVGIIMQGPFAEGLDLIQYRTDHIAALFRADHPLAKKDSIVYSDVLDYDLIGLEASANLMKLLTIEATNLEKTMKLRVEVRSFEAVLKMVLSGLGVGLLPKDFGLTKTNIGDVICKPLPEPWAVRQMFICTRKEVGKTAALSDFLETLLENLN